MNLFDEIIRVTEQWKQINAAAQASEMPSTSQVESPSDSRTASAAPLTFADIPLGDEFCDEDGNCWEKRSEKHAISWIQYEPVEVCDFKPDDIVRMK